MTQKLSQSPDSPAPWKEIRGWLTAFKNGICGMDLTGEKVSGQNNVFADSALKALDEARQGSTFIVLRDAGAAPADSGGAEPPEPPATSDGWTQLGFRFRGWFGDNQREAYRLWQLCQVGPSSPSTPAPQVGEYRHPVLDRIVEGCGNVVGSLRLPMTRLIAGFARLTEAERWDRLREWGWYPGTPCPDTDAAVAVLNMTRFIGRDLTFLQHGRPPCPWWRREAGNLSWNDIPAKTLNVRKAVNVTWVLDEFERLGWPECITVPTQWVGQTVLADTLKSLNTGLQVLRFRARSGEGITWELQT